MSFFKDILPHGEKFKSAQQRRKGTISKLKVAGIDYNKELPPVPQSYEVEIKDIDTICKRAIACMISTQIACDIMQDETDTKDFFVELLEKFGVKEELNDQEYVVVFTQEYTKQNVVNVIWTYESFWAIAWAMGLIEDISNASRPCDYVTAINLVASCESYDEFRQKCNLRPTEEILDMLDLFYCYNWACDHKRINPNTRIGNLNPEVVWERRRGLEWLISFEEDDWFYIELNT